MGERMGSVCMWGVRVRVRSEEREKHLSKDGDAWERMGRVKYGEEWEVRQGGKHEVISDMWQKRGLDMWQKWGVWEQITKQENSFLTCGGNGVRHMGKMGCVGG